jgi:hypothetical protein
MRVARQWVTVKFDRLLGHGVLRLLFEFDPVIASMGYLPLVW